MPLDRIWTASGWVDLSGPPGPKGDAGTPGAPGIPGVKGNNGWTPVFNVVSDGERRVLFVSDWIGGEGTKPGIGYVTDAGGLTQTIAAASDIRGPAGAGAGGGATILKKAADQAITGTTLTDITDWTVPLAANATVVVDALMFFDSNATTNGFQFAAVPQTLAGGALTPTEFMSIFEYQTSATAWATFSQTVPTTYMTLTTASYIANAAMMCRINTRIKNGSTAGQLKFRARAEVNTGVITVREGNILRYY